MADLRGIADALMEGRAKDVKEMVQQALDEKVPVERILHDGMVTGMMELGMLFKNNEVYVPEVLVAARAMKAGMELLKPFLASGEIKSMGKISIGTVKGDLHDIGKNLVAMMLEGAGFTVVDLGIDVSPEAFVQAAKEGAEILCLSALLTTTMPEIPVIIQALKDNGLRDKVKVMIGGAPVTQGYADEVGADGYSSDAASAVDVAKKLIA